MAAGANRASFNNSTSGGIMSQIILQQGKTRTFKILADVATNADNKFIQLAFNAGSIYFPGSATWTVINGISTSTSPIHWTDLEFDTISAAQLTTITPATDTIPPTLKAIELVNKGVAGTLEVGDGIDLVFSERLDPMTINSDLTYGGIIKGLNFSNVGSTGAIGSMQDSNNSLTFQVANIASFIFSQPNPYTKLLPLAKTAHALPNPLDKASTFVNLSLEPTGNVIHLTFASLNKTANNAGYNTLQPYVGYSITGTLQDTAGNNLVAGKTKIIGSW
ncbi:hypothetical protein HZA42_04020 [Candidatus Peregrinibacteria bacterium]|nr:hypothetical protein [Candidatus Peregrinibacteria bacterium]